MMMKRTLGLLMLFVANASCVGPALAGSLIETRLSTVDEVELAVLVPQYEKLPGTDAGVLKDRYYQRVAGLLSEGGLKVVPEARQRLVLKIEYDRDEATPGAVAILVIFELEEPARLVRDWKKGPPSDLSVTSWSRRDLAVVAPGKLEEHLSDAIDAGAKEFAQLVVQAKAYRDRMDNP